MSCFAKIAAFAIASNQTRSTSATESLIKENDGTSSISITNNIPDFRAELLRSAVEGDTIWAEWHWFGTDRDGTRFGVQEVSILGIQTEQIELASGLD